MADYVNEAKRNAEMKSRIVEIQNRIKGELEYNLVEDGRRLLRKCFPQLPPVASAAENTFGVLFAGEGAIKLKPGFHEKSKPAYLYLFNDLVIWTAREPSSELYGLVNVATVTISKYEHTEKVGFVLNSAAFV